MNDFSSRQSLVLYLKETPRCHHGLVLGLAIATAQACLATTTPPRRSRARLVAWWWWWLVNEQHKLQATAEVGRVYVPYQVNDAPWCVHGNLLHRVTAARV